MLKVFFFETEEKMLAIFAVLMSAKTGQLLRKATTSNLRRDHLRLFGDNVRFSRAREFHRGYHFL